MPELPEIETVKRTLEPLICGTTIIKSQIIRPEIVAHPGAAEFRERICNQRIAATGRRGKYLLIHLDSGDTLIAHLRMTGRMLCTPPEHPLHPHTHAIFTLDNGRELRFADTRRFGRLWLLGAGESDDFSGIHRLGIEPFDQAFGAAYLKEKLSRRHIAIKQGILDQSVIAGLGNIYADEVLFAAAVAPFRRTDSMTDTQWQSVAAAICPILNSAISRNGTTFSDYLDGAGREGENMPYLQAYKRAGRACNRCGETMVRTKIGGRSTFYCPNCQK